jgi:hypothetical protein
VPVFGTHDVPEGDHNIYQKYQIEDVPANENPSLLAADTIR